MHVSDLRGILQYIPHFRDRTLVVAVDGEIAASENFSNVLLDLAVLRSLSIRVVLVHGVRHQLQERAARLGERVSNDDGAGVTDEATLRLALDAANRLTHEIMEGLSTVDLRAVYPNAVIAHRAGILRGVDQQFTGKVERVDAAALEWYLGHDIVPVLPPLGVDGDGHTYRLNSDAVAVEVALALKAVKLVFLCEDGSLRRDSGAVVRQLSVSEAEEGLRRGRFGDQPALAGKLEFAVRACRAGVPRVHLLDGHADEALLGEIFSGEGVGTMVYANQYQHIRRALKKDVRRILNLIQQSVRDEELVPRTRADILAHLEDYWILEIDRNVVGCVALHLYREQGMGEMACLYVDRNHADAGHGRRLIAFVEERARVEKIGQLIALSTQAYDYLQQRGGFREASPDILPPSRRLKYDQSGRRSKVLVKPVEPVATPSRVDGDAV